MAALSLLAGPPAHAASRESRWTLYGNTVLRFDEDTGSKTGRADLTRLLVHARLGLAFQATSAWRFDVRGRTGPKSNAQSGFNVVKVFGDGSYGKRGFHADLWQAVWRPDASLDVKLGRVALPVWRTDDTFWDSDVTMPGSFVAWAPGASDGVRRPRLSAGLFSLPDGMSRFYGSLWAVQVEQPLAFARHRLRTSAAFLGIQGVDDVRYVSREHAARDYQLAVLNIEWRPPLGAWSPVVSAMATRNFNSYDPAGRDTYAARFHDDRWGASASLQVGRSGKAGDVRFFYRYLYLEALAVAPVLGTNGISRFGASDFKAHEIGLRVTLPRRAYFQPKLATAERLSNGDRAVRYRVDFGWSF